MARIEEGRRWLVWVEWAGVAGAVVAVVIGWSAALDARLGAVFALAGVATVGLALAAAGVAWHRIGLLLGGLTVAAIAAPVGFAWIGNLVALGAAVTLGVCALRQVTSWRSDD